MLHYFSLPDFRILPITSFTSYYKKYRLWKINMNLIIRLKVIVSTRHHRNELCRKTFLFGLIPTYTLSAIPTVGEEFVNGTYWNRFLTCVRNDKEREMDIFGGEWGQPSSRFSLTPLSLSDSIGQSRNVDSAFSFPLDHLLRRMMTQVKNFNRDIQQELRNVNLDFLYNTWLWGKLQ